MQQVQFDNSIINSEIESLILVCFLLTKKCHRYDLLVVNIFECIKINEYVFKRNLTIVIVQLQQKRYLF